MKVSAIWTYPVKSLRGVSLPRAEITPQGVKYDRRFMLRLVHRKEGSLGYMGVYHYPLMACFTTALDYSSEGEEGVEKAVIVTFHPPPPKEKNTTNGEDEEDDEAADEGDDAAAVDDGNIDRTPRNLRIPLEPNVDELERTEISMHGSNTAGFLMGEECTAFFTDCFGFGVELVYCGENRRKVLGNLSPNAVSEKSASWMQTIASVPLVGSALAGPQHEQGLGLADIGAMLVLSETSFGHVNRALPDGLEVDIRKFRPNLVISGAEEEFEEDYWGSLDVAGKRVLLTQNCNRCVSLNVDFTTGRFCKGPLGKVWANLYKDRRMDTGMKYNPTFGRYGWIEEKFHGDTIAVGDEVTVAETIKEMKTFDWPFKVPS